MENSHNNNLSLSSKIEAVLFYKNEPVAVKKLAELVGEKPEAVETALRELQGSLAGRGLQLVFGADDVRLGTSAAASPLIEAMEREEISRDLGKAGLETLAIVLYRGPVSRREIDYIRGVNSSFILRNLLVRGLIERMEGKAKLSGANERGFSYRASSELISFMGLSRIEDLPEFAAVRSEMEKFASHAEQPEGSEKQGETDANERETPESEG